jgi:cation/acetate symporter
MTFFAADVNECTRDLRDRRCDHAGDHLLGIEAGYHRDGFLGRRPRPDRRPERIRNRRRLHVGGLVSGHRRADLPILFREARAQSPEGEAYLKPGLFLSSPIDTVSLGIALVLGTAGLPHILMRFFTVPDAKAARSSVMWAVVLIGAFYVMTTALGFGARAILGEGATEAVGTGGNLAAPLLAEEVGGGAGTVGGDLFLAIIAAVAFATILAVVAGLTLAGASALSHDIFLHVIRGGRATDREEVRVARLSTVVFGVLAVLLGIIFKGQNVAFMVGLAFAIACSANFPPLLLSITWRRFNTAGAVAAISIGAALSVMLIVLSPTVWVEIFHFSAPVFPLRNPAIVSMPCAFLAGALASLATREPEAEVKFDDEKLRTYLGVGAE